jgi:c-di-GMP-binding flagellar brake protein YcgR
MFWRSTSGDGSDPSGKKSRKTRENFSLEFIKLEAGVPPDHEVVIRQVTDTEIIFKSTASLKEKEKTPLIVIYHPFAPGKKIKPVELLFYVTITEKGQLSDTVALYKASYIDKNEPGLKHFFQYLQQIEVAQLDKLVDYHERRIHYRLNRVLPIYSKHLKGFKGLTRDISSTGVHLSCGGGVKKGDIISLQMEFDDETMMPLHLRGQVCWVDDSLPPQVRVGIKFLDIEEHEQKMLHKYIEDIRKRLEGD